MFVLLLHNKWNPRYLNQELPIPSLWTVNFTQLLIVGYLGEVIDSRFYWNQLQKCCWQNIVITFVSTQWKPCVASGTGYSSTLKLMVATECLCSEATNAGLWHHLWLTLGHLVTAITYQQPIIYQNWCRNGFLIAVKEMEIYEYTCVLSLTLSLVPSAASWASQVF